MLKRALELADKDNANLTVLTVSNAAFTNLYLGEISGDFLEKIRAGAKDAGAITRFLIGSVSSQVVTHAPCSVLVVKK